MVLASGFGVSGGQRIRMIIGPHGCIRTEPSSEIVKLTDGWSVRSPNHFTKDNRIISHTASAYARVRGLHQIESHVLRSASAYAMRRAEELQRTWWQLGVVLERWNEARDPEKSQMADRMKEDTVRTKQPIRTK